MKNHIPAKKRQPKKWVWIAEDYKYGVLGVYASKGAANKDYGPNGKCEWESGYGGEIVKREVKE